MFTEIGISLEKVPIHLSNTLGAKRDLSHQFARTFANMKENTSEY